MSYRTDVVTEELEVDSLVGSHFHTFNEDGSVDKQGIVVAEPHSGYYLCEYQEFLTGCGHHQELKRIDDMLTWHFYDDVGWKCAAYEDNTRKHYPDD